MYVVRNLFQSEAYSLQESVPLFFDRYRDLILSYAFLRERIINDNNLETFEWSETYNHNIDLKYAEASTKIESEIIRFKNQHDQIVQPLIDLTVKSDSE